MFFMGTPEIVLFPFGCLIPVLTYVFVSTARGESSSWERHSVYGL